MKLRCHKRAHARHEYIRSQTPTARTHRGTSTASPYRKTVNNNNDQHDGRVFVHPRAALATSRSGGGGGHCARRYLLYESEYTRCTVPTYLTTRARRVTAVAVVMAAGNRSAPVVVVVVVVVQ